MTIVFSATSRLEAWAAAADYLLAKGPSINIILSIGSPASQGVAPRAAAASIDEFYASEGEPPLHTVAETIFPAWEYRHRGLRGVFETYPTEFDTLKKAEPYRWGTYAHRLVRRRTATGEMVNPLDTLITKMRNEIQQTRRGTYHACYELGVAEGEYDIPLYNTVDDQGRRRGLPCLSHLSFKIHQDALHLTAVYRSHDYRYKVPGNLLGLARLQACVAHEAGLPLGTLVVHSTYAYADVAKGKKSLKALIASVQVVLSKERHELADGVR